MKKISLAILSILLVVLFGSLAAFADVQPADSSSANTVTSDASANPVAASNSQDTSIVQDASQNSVSITPDNPFYIFKRLIESLQVTLTFSPDGKAQILVNLANERLAEAKIMTEKNKQQLAENVMKSYLKTVNQANSIITDAAQSDNSITPALEELKVSEQTGDNFVISMSGNFPKESEEQIKTAIANEVKRTLAIQELSVLKSQIKDAENKLNEAEQELKDANTSGDTSKIAQAQQKVQQAEQYKEQVENAKQQVQEYKNSTNESISQQDKEEIDNQSNDNRNVEKEKFQKRQEKQKERAERFKEKADKQYKKFLEKAQRIENKKFKQTENEDRNDNEDSEEDD